VTRASLALSAIVAFYVPFCTKPVERTVPQESSPPVNIAELWNSSADVSASDLFNGPWGAAEAPDPNALYTFVAPKTHGVSPGMTVRDPNGVQWSIKQGEEGPVEVTLSRVLSALGYHQPPVYFLRTFKLTDGIGMTRSDQPGGRFRPHHDALKDVGEWSWQQNPFVDTTPYHGLLVILLMFDSSDLKNSNNSMYQLREPREGASRWYVVRDLGTALGETGRLDPKRNDPDLFDRHKFIEQVSNGHVEFSYHGWHQELFRDRIAPGDVRWACELMGKLSDAQWADAFRAGGYEPAAAQRFIARLKEKIEEGRRLDATSAR
jgi:hypothetical protein